MTSSDDSTSPPRRRALAGASFVLTAAALFAVNGTVSKLVLGSGLGSLRLVEIRCLAAAVIFLAIAVARRPSSLAVRRRELGFLVGYGVVGVALVQWLYFAAIARMPVSISLLLEFTAPLLVALWVRFVRHEAVRPRIWVALVLVLAGLALVARIWAGLTLDGTGLVCAVLAAGPLAAYYLLGEAGLGTRDPLSLAAWSFTAAAAFWAALLPWWTYPFHRLTAPITLPVGGGVHVPTWTLVGWVVVAGTVVPVGVVRGGLSRVGATRAGLLGTAEPPLAGMVAWAMIGETLSVAQLVGAVVVLAGILVAETARGRVAAQPQAHCQSTTVSTPGSSTSTTSPRAVTRTPGRAR